MRIMIAALMLVLCLYVTAAPAPQKPLSKPQSCQCAVQMPPVMPDTRGTAQSPLIVNATLPPKTAEDARNEQNDRAERRATDNFTIILAAVTGIILLLQLFVFGRQAQRLRESVDEMKIATAATKTTARATQRTVATMKSTARRQLRAYVFVDSSSVTGVSVGDTPAARVVFKNYGQTPAYNITVVGGIGLGVSFDKLPASNVVNDTNKSQGNLGPGGVVYFFSQAPRSLTDAEVTKLSQGTLTLFVHGTARFRDAFRKDRFLNFRLMTGGPAGIIQGNRLASCREGNETDDPD